MHKKTSSAVIWTFLSQLGTTGISSIFALIFARYMLPSDFGAFAAGILCVSLSSHLAGLGLASAIVQNPKIDKKIISTAFWMSIGSASVIGSIVIAISTQIAIFFGDPRVSDIILPLAAAMVLGSGATVLTAVLRRDLKIRSITIRTLFANLVSGAIATPLALGGHGIDALVLQSVAGTILTFITTLFLTVSHIRVKFDPVTGKELLKFGIPVMKADFLNLLNHECPKFFIGPILGTGALGIYSMAIRLLNLLLMVIASTLSSVAFPVLSEVQRSNPAQVGEAHLRWIKFGGMICIPIFLLCAVSSEFVITFALGVTWGAAAPVFMLLCLTGIPIALGYLNGATIMAIGEPQVRYRVTLIGTLIGIVLLATVTPLGLFWAAGALLTRSLITESIMARVAYSKIGKNFPNDTRNLIGPIVGGLAMTAVAFSILMFIQRWDFLGSSSFAILLTVTSVAVPVYVIFVWYFDRNIYNELYSQFRTKKRKF